MKVLFVCTGNTCRSPMAEGILKSLADSAGVSSAGLAAVDGMPASENAVRAMEETGLDITSHRARRITQEMAQNADLILCMTQSHKMALSSLNPNTFTLGEFVGSGEQVPDPFGGDLAAYRLCRDRLMSLLRAALPKLLGEAQ